MTVVLTLILAGLAVIITASMHVARPRRAATDESRSSDPGVESELLRRPLRSRYPL